MKTILKKTLSAINRILKTKRIFYYSVGTYSAFGRTAVKTKFGFWYVGNVLDQSDIACGILNNGLVEPEETNLVLKIFTYLKSSGSVSIGDIGANTGYYSFLAANFFGEQAKVNSFEPVSEFADCIDESMRMNQFEKNITVHRMALSDANGTSEIYVSGTCSSLEKDFNNDESLPKRTVVTKKLDDMVHEKDITFDFIKMDVEGHELMVLKGARETLKKQKPIVFLEITDTFRAHRFVNAHYGETLDLLHELGYEGYRLERDGSLRKIAKVAGGGIDGVYMHLFVDRKKHGKLMGLLDLDQNEKTVQSYDDK